MADIFVQTGAYHGTFVIGTVEGTSHFQICASASINASNEFMCSFWINENGVRIDSNLGDASYRVRDKDGNVVSGVTESGIGADVNGYYHIAPVSAAGILDLNHYILEIEIPVNGVEKASSLAIVSGE